jgi:hypothetical protein
VHPPHVKEAALALIAQGINDCEISRRLGIPRRTIMDWRRPTYVPRREILLESCPRCWRAAKPIRFSAEDYTELLGLYLGDGCITELARTERMRIVLDAKYPRLIRETHALLERCFPANSVGITIKDRGSCFVVWVYSQHMACLFPQHGPGKKHQRRLILEPWQADLLRQAPWGFIRGCIRSDGCAFVNRTGPYEYLSYDFSNLSKDLVDLFCTACDLAGVQYRMNGGGRLWDVRINRRDSVALMVEHVGLKT